MRVSRILVGLSACLLALPAASPAQTSCAPTTGTATASMPAFSGTLGGVLSMPTGADYVYIMTQYGVARASISDPAHPGPVVLAQVGHKSENGNDNGGKVPAG